MRQEPVPQIRLPKIRFAVVRKIDTENLDLAAFWWREFNR